MTSKDKDMECVNTALSLLQSRFLNGRIFVQRQMDSKDFTERPCTIGDTTSGSWGFGNYYASYGQINLWTEEQKEHIRVEARHNG